MINLKSYRKDPWDFGPQPGYPAYLPLSDDWRNRQIRINDWSTRVLILLQRYQEQVGANQVTTSGV